MMAFKLKHVFFLTN